MDATKVTWVDNVVQIFEKFQSESPRDIPAIVDRFCGVITCEGTREKARENLMRTMQHYLVHYIELCDTEESLCTLMADEFKDKLYALFRRGEDNWVKALYAAQPGLGVA